MLRRRRSAPWRRRPPDHAGEAGAICGDLRHHHRGHGHGAGLPGRLIPVPRSITAGCGMCWSAPPEAQAELEDLVVREKLDVDGLYTVLL